MIAFSIIYVKFFTMDFSIYDRKYEYFVSFFIIIMPPWRSGHAPGCSQKSVLQLMQDPPPALKRRP